MNIVLMVGADKELWATMLGPEFENQVRFAANITECKEKLHAQEIGIVVAEIDEEELHDLYRYQEEKDLNIPVLFVTDLDLHSRPECAPFLESNPDNSFLPKKFKMEHFVQRINKALHCEQHHLDSFYSKVESRKLLDFDFGQNISVFLRLNNGRYVNILKNEHNKANVVEIVQKYIERGIDYLYLEQGAYLALFSEMLENNIEKLGNEQLPPAQIIETQGLAVESIHEMVKGLGLSSEVMTLAEKSVERTYQMLKRDTNLMGILNKIIVRKNYIYNLALITNYVGVALAMNIDCQSRFVLEKISYAALLQDISLDDEKLAQINDLSKASLSARERRIVELHPINSTRIIEQIKDLPPDTTGIIAQHHERPDGSGFPHQRNVASISLLAATFILAREFSREFLLHRSSPLEIVSKFPAAFDQANFRRPYKALLELFKV